MKLKLMLTQPPTELELELGLSLATNTIANLIVLVSFIEINLFSF